jgi:hypothetical protein
MLHIPKSRRCSTLAAVDDAAATARVSYYRGDKASLSHRLAGVDLAPRVAPHHVDIIDRLCDSGPKNQAESGNNILKPGIISVVSYVE